ncbi:oxidoreductase [Rodentibacter caecimuris]|uniref:Aspartate-semialdehyde dehydrogenase n=1 Tax=Rodentibacter caecimuris TaxID=1796644 RepID=A0ABX3KX29_9PAST|nr:aspartate-semialdehyde dehydrogenase [Rodentibacter heylii]
MDATSNIATNVAIAAEFELCEKILEMLKKSAVEIGGVSIVEIYPFDEEQGLRFQNKTVQQLSPDEIDWSVFNYVFFAGDLSTASYLAKAAEAGCVVIDVKGICASLSDVPIVIPSINEESLIELRQRNIVSLPDVQVSQLALSIFPFLQYSEIQRLFVTSLLPVSYTGNENVGKLAGQTARLLNGIPLEGSEQRFAFDVFPQQISHLSLQFRKIFPQINEVVFHQIQVPVFYGLAQKVSLFSEYEWHYEPQNSLWLQVHSELITPVLNGENENGQENISLHLTNFSLTESGNGAEFWTVADDQRFSLAFLSVKLFESIYQQGY